MEKRYMPVEKAIIVSALHEMGIRSGDYIGLHANVPSLGRVLINVQKEGGTPAVHRAVNDVIDSFVSAVGWEKGLVMVPTFSYCFAGSEYKPYHPRKSPSRVGLLTELFFNRPDAIRSLHPTHSVAAIGGRAGEITKDHEKKTALGIDSPFYRLAKLGGWICYLGTSSTTLSLLHVAEAVAGVPYLDTFCYGYLGWKGAAIVETNDGGVREVPLKDIPGCSENFGTFDQLMEKAGIIRKGDIYQSHVKLFKAGEALELAVDKLRQEPFWLLCPEGRCDACDVRWKAHGR
jgi:aminoglycoside 3-N-acetyltransferase